MPEAFFTREDDSLVPTSFAASLWSADQLHGVAISGALAKHSEEFLDTLGRSDLQPVRYHVDLFKPARMQPCDLVSTLVRQGPRIALVDTSFTQAGEPVARASTSYLLPTENAPGQTWHSDPEPTLPPADLVPPTTTPHVPWMRSDSGWSQEFGKHADDSAKVVWSTPLHVVAGEQPTAFQAVASVADATSMSLNWGSRGVEYINTDISLTLARLPRGIEIGLRAVSRTEYDGLAVGVVEVFDRDGVIGSASTSTMANSRRRVTFEDAPPGSAAPRF